MKKILFLYFCICLVGCKKEPDNYCNPHCLNGFECDPVSEECICPEGSYINNGQCLPINKETMYIPVEANSNCFCFYDITSLRLDESFNPPAFKFTQDNSYGLFYPFGQISLYPNTENPETWEYLHSFISGTNALPCKLNGQFVNAHMYINMNYDTIWIKADIVPYIADDLLHWQEYPVISSCDLMFVKPQ